MSNQEAATKFVISELGKHRQKNEITEKLCRNYEMSWRQAQAFVNKVEAENAGSINLRQSPLYIIVGLLILVGGIGLTAWIGMQTFVNHASYSIYGIPYAGNVSFGITGVGMVIGGLVGMLTPLAKKK
jgi:predicted phage tail protein